MHILQVRSCNLRYGSKRKSSEIYLRKRYKQDPLDLTLHRLGPLRTACLTQESKVQRPIGHAPVLVGVRPRTQVPHSRNLQSHLLANFASKGFLSGLARIDESPGQVPLPFARFSTPDQHDHSRLPVHDHPGHGRGRVQEQLETTRFAA